MSMTHEPEVAISHHKWSLKKTELLNALFKMKRKQNNINSLIRMLSKFRWYIDMAIKMYSVLCMIALKMAQEHFLNFFRLLLLYNRV